MFGKGKLREIQQKNKIAIEQQFLFLLLRQHILNLPGKSFLIDGLSQDFVSKDEIADGIADILNTYCGDDNEIDQSKN